MEEPVCLSIPTVIVSQRKGTSYLMSYHYTFPMGNWSLEGLAIGAADVGVVTQRPSERTTGIPGT